MNKPVFQTIFQDDNGEWLSPKVSGGSAGLNSAMFFVCPLCYACIVDMHHEAINRIAHNEWHNRQDQVQPAMDLKDVHTIFDWNPEATTIKEAVGNAIGLASLCWSEAPTGIFDDARASAIVNELTDFIEYKQYREG